MCRARLHGSASLHSFPLWPALLLMIVSAVTACTRATFQDSSSPGPPAAEREAWDVRIELREPDSVVRISSPYVADELDPRATRMDSGAALVFAGLDGSVRCRMEAQRLLLVESGRRLMAGGRVRVRAGEDLTLEADSLVWDGDTGRLEVPVQMRLTTSRGWERGRALVADLNFSTWTMEDVSGAWRVSGPQGGRRLHVSSARVTGHRRDGRYRLRYDGVEVTEEKLRARAQLADLDEDRGLVIFRRGVKGTDGAYVFRADSARLERNMERVSAWGGVVVRDTAGAEGGGFTLRARRTVHQRSSGKLRARRAVVRFAARHCSLRADDLSYDRRSGRMRAWGSVEFQDSLAFLRADTLVYERKTAHVSAWGGVDLRAKRLQGSACALRLEYDVTGSVGVLDGDARLERTRSDSSKMRVETPAMKLDLGNHLLETEGEVAVSTSEEELSAHRGLYRYQASSSLLVLAGDVEWRQRTTAQQTRTRMAADSMRVELRDGRIVHIDLARGVRVRQVAPGKREVWISAGKGSVTLAGGHLDRFALETEAQATYRDAGRREITRFGGREMVLYFTGDQLLRARVEGDAHLVSQSLTGDERASDVNQVKGEQLDMRFDQDHVEVRVGPQVNGTYHPAHEE